MQVGQLFFLGAAVCFFFAVAGVTILDEPTAWGFLMLSVGFLCGDWKLGKQA